VILILDHGLGNLLSVKKAVEEVAGSEKVTVSDNPLDLMSADRIILPGVGNFKTGISNLRRNGLVEPLRERVLGNEIPLLGICLGMQLLCEWGEEDGLHKGIGLIDGHVRKLDAGGFPLPHLGWDDIESTREDYLLSGLVRDKDYYFVHSYVVECPKDFVVAWCDYGERFPALIRKGNICGSQFHPEKSRGAGLSILRNFLVGSECSKSEWFLSFS